HGADGVPEALHALDRVLAIDADDPDALEKKATILFREGRVQDARPLFARAAASGPACGASHVALAVLAGRDGRTAEAIAELEKARRVAPGDAWILDRLHDAYVKSGDTVHAGELDRARRYFTKRARVETEATAWLPAAWR
ncbi:MAG: tetratricopeptide repeat protein, partial [Polyangiaceae bacterium]